MQVNQVRLGAVLSYVSMGLSTLISLIYTPIMLDRLGETEYGVYGAVGPIISYLLLLSMGLGSAYIRYYSQAKVAQDRREMAKLNGMFLVTLSLLGLVLLALGFFLAAHPQMVFGTKWAPEELALGAKLLRIMTVNAALSFPFSVFESHVNIHERYLFLKAVTMAKSVLSPLISIPLLLLGFRSPTIATLSLVLTIVCGLTYIVLLSHGAENADVLPDLRPAADEEHDGLHVLHFPGGGGGPAELWHRHPDDHLDPWCGAVRRILQR